MIASSTMATKLSSTRTKTTQLRFQSSRRISEPSIRQNCARTGSSLGSVPSRIPAPSPMVLKSSTVKLMFLRTTRQSSANDSMRSCTAHMVPDASSSILLSTCSKRAHQSSNTHQVFLHLSIRNRFLRLSRISMQPSLNLFMRPHIRLWWPIYPTEKHQPSP